ncbi:MAG: T9SS type A sorting domain-containing protein [Bacteroidota bacterium]|nr:T9SS type A sorting domain-containing protein [Bacteroidota bacterium]
MKKSFLLVLALFASVALFAQTVSRNVVVMEIGTATWCTYCPGSAKAVDQMDQENRAIGVIEYHSSDSYTNAASTARLGYYSMSGIPDAVFDGQNPSVGGYPCAGGGSCYNEYMNKYNNRIAVPSPVSITIDGTGSGDTYNVILSIFKVGTISSTNLKVHLALTESNITQSWQGCMTKVNNVERMMIPDQNGTNIDFNSGDMVVLSLSFTKTSSWVTSNCKLVAFVQDNSTKEIFNGAVADLNALTPPMPVTFTTTDSVGCAPFQVNYSSAAPQANTYQWSFPGGTPSASSDPNPSVTYTTEGLYNARLVAWDNVTYHGNIDTKVGYISVGTSLAAPATPTGPTTVYTNTTPTSDYISTGTPNALSYTWSIDPPEAGTISGNFTTGTVTWAAGFGGQVSVSLQGVGSCGTGTASQPIIVEVSPALGISEPAKHNLITLYPNPAKSYVNIISSRELKADIRIYNTMGSIVLNLGKITLKDSYQLNLSGLVPGVYFVNLTGDNFQENNKIVIE